MEISFSLCRQHHTKFRKDRSNRCGDIAIFVIFKTAAAAMLDFQKVEICFCCEMLQTSRKERQLEMAALARLLFGKTAIGVSSCWMYVQVFWCNCHPAIILCWLSIRCCTLCPIKMISNVFSYNSNVRNCILIIFGSRNVYRKVGSWKRV